MTMFTYTFIIPHHNSPELLNRCLKSIPQRNDIQIIVVDDNSKENLRPKITRTDVEVLFIDAQHTKGAGHARNVGLGKAQGKWLLFADCDDYYCDGFIGVLDKYSNLDIDILYFNVKYINSGRLIPPNEFYITSYFEQYDGSERTLENIKYRINAPWVKMINAKFVFLNNFQFEEVPNGNDMFFSLIVAVNAKKIKVDKAMLYTYIYNDKGLTYKKKTDDEIACEIVHSIKRNQFYKSINHCEWQSYLFKYVLVCIMISDHPFKLMWNLAKAIKSNLQQRNDWNINNLNYVKS